MSSNPRPTIRDVAALAGVSLKTVSRVINSEAGVSAATTARVVAAIDELSFQRNDLARSLRQGQTSSTVGLVIEDAANPFYSAIVQAVERAAWERSYLLITATCEEDADRERELVRSLMRRRVDALLLVPASRDHSYVAREMAGTPVVFLDRPPAGIEADQVLIDNVGGGRDGTAHLLAQGHQRIAFIADRETLYTASERLKGYREALERAGLTVVDELVRTGSHDAIEAEGVVAELLRLPAGAGRRPSSPATTATPSARCGPLRSPAGPSRSSGSTTSSWPTCSCPPSPSSGTTATGWVRAPPSSRSRDSTARSYRPAASSCRPSLSFVDQGEVPPS